MQRFFRVSFLTLVGLLGCGPASTPPAPSVTLAPAASSSSAAPASVSSARQGATAASAAPTASGASAGVRTLWVREGLVDCEGEGPMKCLQVRESEASDWRLFYGKIEGFSPDPAFSYELRVTAEPAPAGRMDAPARRYRLVEVVAKKGAGGRP